MMYGVALSAGIFSNVLWPQLPPGWFLAFLLLIALLLLCWRQWLLAGFFSGALWGLVFASQVDRQQLSQIYDRQTFMVTGTVTGLIDSDLRRTRFSFLVDHVESSDQLLSLPLEKLLLSDYGGRTFAAGQRWRLQVQLRRPRGLANPAGMNYRAWLLQQGFSATGYLSREGDAQLLSESNFHIDRVRQKLAQAISRMDSLDVRSRAVLAAITVGDRRELHPWWDTFARLGIVHLLVISGLHIGLVGGFGYLLGSGFARLWALAGEQFSVRWLPPLSGLVAALCYAALAGFSLPTMRALIAVAVVMIARLVYRRQSAWQVFVAALSLVALLDPLAVLGGSFWLSFSAVAVLIWWFSPWRKSARRSRFLQAITAQLALSLVLAVPLLLIIGRASWLAPLVNLVAVPWVSLVSVPLALLGAFFQLLEDGSWFGELLWFWSGESLSLLFSLLEWLLAWLPEDRGFLLPPVSVGFASLFAALLLVVSLLMPAGMVARGLALLPALLLVLFPRPDPPLRVTVLDVGQGTAVVVEAGKHSLVYDAGPAYSDSFDAGSGIVAPYLWARGRGGLNRLMISHEDSDHAGGVDGLLALVRVDQQLVNPFVAQRENGLLSCHRGVGWVWGEVAFEVLAPEADQMAGGNDNSCVLMVRWRDQHILLPGDIERWGEYRLAAQWQQHLGDQPLALLLAPHHGSKTSSTEKFVDLVSPQHVVFSAGYKHRFGHPHRSVVERYKRSGALLWNTAEQGAIQFTWRQDGSLNVESERDKSGLWWQ